MGVRQRLARSRRPTATSLITHLRSISEHDRLLASRKERLVVIDFHATWCGPCHAVAPTYEKLSQQYKGATFCKVDVDAARDIAQQYKVTAMPTFVFLKNGSEVERVRGANIAAIQAALQKHAGAGAAAGGTFPGAGHTLSGAPAPAPAGNSPPSKMPMYIVFGLLALIWIYNM